jgi:hypothetical protein
MSVALCRAGTKLDEKALCLFSNRLPGCRRADMQGRLVCRGRAGDCSAAFATRWQDKGRAAALKEYLADDARQLLAGAAVTDGRAAWLTADPLRDAVLGKLRTAKTLSADRGDLQVSYGEYDVAARLDTPARRYVFVHAWDVGRSCRLALESLNPVR